MNYIYKQLSNKTLKEHVGKSVFLIGNGNIPKKLVETKLVKVGSTLIHVQNVFISKVKINGGLDSNNCGAYIFLTEKDAKDFIEARAMLHGSNIDLYTYKNVTVEKLLRIKKILQE